MKDYIGGDDFMENPALKKSRWKKFLEDLPIYLNGFSVGYLTFGRAQIGVTEIICFFLCLISFIWYGQNKKTI